MPTLPTIDLTKWYWTVGGDQTKVWSGAAFAYVPVTDPTYVAWLKQPSIIGPTPIDTEANLAAVLVDVGIWMDLRAYAASVRYAKETAGITVGTAAIATDRESQALITGMWAASQINPQIQVSFKSSSGFVTIGAAQVAKIAAAVASYVQACFTAEAQVVAAIAAGTVKMAVDVDAAFAAALAPPSA